MASRFRLSITAFESPSVPFNFVPPRRQQLLLTPLMLSIAVVFSFLCYPPCDGTHSPTPFQVVLHHLRTTIYSFDMLATKATAASGVFGVVKGYCSLIFQYFSCHGTHSPAPFFRLSLIVSAPPSTPLTCWPLRQQQHWVPQLLAF